MPAYYMLRTIILTLFFTAAVFAQQAELLNNVLVIEMSRAGLAPDIILRKISTSDISFDITAAGLVELKKAGVDDSVIAFMMDRCQQKALACGAATPASHAVSVTANKVREVPGTSLSEDPATRPAAPVRSKRESLATAKTIALEKSSLQPSRQALEKELMKRKDFQALDLSILRYKEQADLFVEIGFVSGSWITHRYVYRIYDRRSGAVIAAGETTSWGSLAENLARHIAKSLTAIRDGKSGT